MEEYRSEIVSRIRSCLISTKGQVTLRQLEADYRTLLGERIPYQKLGHKTLESLIQSIPTIVTHRGPNGEVFVDAQVSEKSAHISSMVRKQKSVAPRRKIRIAPAPRYYRVAAHPPATFNKWRPKKNLINFGNGGASQARRPYQGNSSRLAAVSHNQFVSSPGYKKPTVPSKIVVPERKEARKVPSPPAPKEPKELRRFNSAPESRSEESNGFGLNNAAENCSPLSSTMRRISRLMSEINVDRDSGNSSPTAEYAATGSGSPTAEYASTYKLAEFSRTGDPIVDIRNFAAYHKLGDVEVKFAETKAKKSKVAQCHCKITVGQHKYSSYPEEFTEEASAERHASQKALDDLMQKYSRRKSLLLSSAEDIIARIPPMLEKHNNAVWMWQIELDYLDKYNEQLPSDWLQIIDNSPFVTIEKNPGGFILTYCNPDNKGKRTKVSLNLADVSVPCNTVKFGETNRIFAMITATHSSDLIWCQHCGTPEFENFVNMAKKMEEYYNSNSSELVASHITKNSCYVTQQEDGAWLRVRALTVPEEGFVDCFLIDFGEEIHVPVDKMYTMRREFATIEAQVFVCRLNGLEYLSDVSMDSEYLANLAGKQVVVELITDEPGDKPEGDIIIPVVMYDDSGNSINEELLSILMIESAEPVLDPIGVTEVYVSNIEPNGDIYVQVRSVGHFGFVEILNNMSENLNKDPTSYPRTIPTRETSEKTIYLAQDLLTKKWLRATVLDWSPKCDLAQIYFIDEGMARVINVADEKMYRLDHLDEMLMQYPPQAVKVRIMIEKIPGDFVERAKRLIPKDQPVLLKTIDFDNENVAWVEFFKRTSDGVLVFINKSISVEAELSNFDVNFASNNNNNENARKRLINLVQISEGTKTVPSGGSLKKPDLPKTGDYFNVNIPFSVNPWNFFIQPLDSFYQLTAMMQDMQENYKDVQFSPMQIEDIVPGKIYASKHEDGRWYRTSVLKVIHSGSISVFYCDFGYYTNLTLTQLVPLDGKYMSLPYQALKAKIAGIKPIKNKWTMEDCDFYSSLVTKKQFVSILVNIEKDELYKSDIVLQLLLIDTSSDEDINIKEVLIARGIATNV